MQNTLEATWKTAVLSVYDSRDWPMAAQLCGSMKAVGMGRFEFAISPQNLTRVYEAFQGPKRPVVVSGQRIIDGLRARYLEHRRAVAAIREILSRDRFAVEPNGKFHPYAHQTLGLGVLLANPFTPMMLSCGLGKTGTTCRGIEICIRRGDIKPGKILVSAPLSILSSSWLNDMQKFTDLRGAILWTDTINEKILGEPEFLCVIGPEPSGAVSTKKVTKVRYFSHSRQILLDHKPNELEAAEIKDWVKYDAGFRVAVMTDGVKVPYGPVVGRRSETDNTREKFIIEQLQRNDVDVFLINHDGVRIYEDILRRHGFEWVVVDESTKIKNISSAVTQAHINISWESKRRCVLSGTPNPNGFEDLWAQYYFLDRGLTLGTKLADYRQRYFVPEVTGTYKTPQGKMASAVKYVIRDESTKQDLIKTVKEGGIFLEQRDCIDLPPRTDMIRAVMMTPEQEQAYLDMEADLRASFQGRQGTLEVEAVNTLSKIMKLRQITSGFIIDSATQAKAHLERMPKIEDLDDFIEELGGNKIIIVCQFVEEIKLLLERYKHLGAAAIYGGVKDPAERERLVKAFQETNDIQVMILQPQAAGHGLTLTAAHYMVFISLDYNYEYYHQVGKRIERIGQQHPMTVIQSVARLRDGSPTIDEDLVDILGLKDQGRRALFDDGNGGPSQQEIATQLRDRILARGKKAS